MCVLKAYAKVHETSSDLVSTGGGKPITEDSKTEYIKALSVSFNFIDTWLTLLDYN